MTSLRDDDKTMSPSKHGRLYFLAYAKAEWRNVLVISSLDKALLDEPEQTSSRIGKIYGGKGTQDGSKY